MYSMPLLLKFIALDRTIDKEFCMSKTSLIISGANLVFTLEVLVTKTSSVTKISLVYCNSVLPSFVINDPPFSNYPNEWEKLAHFVMPPDQLCDTERKTAPMCSNVLPNFE